MQPDSSTALCETGTTAAGRPTQGSGGLRAAPAYRPDRPNHDARVLTAGGVEAEIRLDGVRYVLRITRQGKLILTK